MIFVVSKLASIIMDDWNLNEIHANYGIKFWYYLHPNNYVMKYYHGWKKLDEKSLSKW